MEKEKINYNSLDELDKQFKRAFWILTVLVAGVLIVSLISLIIAFTFI